MKYNRFATRLQLFGGDNNNGFQNDMKFTDDRKHSKHFVDLLETYFKQY